jgi:hypothetical protein
VLTGFVSICMPSRGPSSWIMTCFGSAIVRLP